MCGIFGFVGTSPDAPNIVHEGLQRLEYRGYDSWGVATVKSGRIEVYKKVGIVSRDPLPLPRSTAAIGHTRWATHGAVTEINAHPHTATDGSFSLAHNGIVENADEIKKILTGSVFSTQTDTEVIVRLIEKELGKKMAFPEALQSAFKKLEGRSTILVLTKEGDIYAIRNGSPLVLGTNTKGDILFSSDSLSLGGLATKIVVVENGHMVTCIQGVVVFHSLATGKKVKSAWEPYTVPHIRTDKGIYPHYMLKEIHESPLVVEQVVKDKASYTKLLRALKSARTVYCIGSGTAGVASQQIAFYLRSIGGIRAVALIGGEASEYTSLIGKGDICIAPSQSGETADVLEVLEQAQKQGATIVSYVNMYGSMMTRMSDFAYMANAGPEICVMSTKMFVSQIAWGYLLAHRVRGTENQGASDLKKLIRGLKQYLKDVNASTQLTVFAREASRMPHLFLMAKGQNAAIIREGMVKIIEGSYVHAHAIPAGDLKHYAITLVEKNTPIIALLSDDVVRHDIENAVHEVRARGARVICVGTTGDIKVPDTGPTSAIMNVIPLQLLAYHMAVVRGNNVDKPRNIAKSVTVK